MAEFESLPRYLAAAKNVRGLAVYDPAAPPEREYVRWLSRRHQYRNVGISAGLVDHPTVDLMDYATFEAIEYPFASLGDFATELSGSLPDWVAERLVLGASHVTPLFLHADGLAAFEELACWRPLPVVELDDEAVLRHMRIAGYGMLDFIEASAVEAREALLGGDEARADAMSERAERARQDGEDRFWRLLDPDETDEGATGRSPGADREWAGGYFDVLPHVTEEAAALVDSDPAVAVGLGLVAGFVAGPERH